MDTLTFNRMAALRSSRAGSSRAEPARSALRSLPGRRLWPPTRKAPKRASSGFGAATTGSGSTQCSHPVKGESVHFSERKIGRSPERHPASESPGNPNRIARGGGSGRRPRWLFAVRRLCLSSAPLGRSRSSRALEDKGVDPELCLAARAWAGGDLAELREL